jgi:hypothetical protein
MSINGIFGKSQFHPRQLANFWHKNCCKVTPRDTFVNYTPTRRPLLFLSSFTLTPIGLPCGLLSQIDLHQLGGVRAYLVLSEYLSGLGLAFSPVVRHLRQMIS